LPLIPKLQILTDLPLPSPDNLENINLSEIPELQGLNLPEIPNTYKIIDRKN
jgi:hypothetical protein